MMNDIEMEKIITEENFKLFEELANSDENRKASIIAIIVNKNIGLVKNIAYEYSKYNQASNDDLNDYIGEGSLGLLEAIEKYDYTTGNKFSTYATPKIEGKIIDYIYTTSSTIHIPKEKLQLINRINKAKSELEGDLERDVNYDEVYELFKDEIKKEKFDQLVGSSKMKYTEKIEDYVHDKIVEQSRQIEVQESVNEKLNQLDDREKLILNMAFGTNGYEEHSYKEIAEKLNLSPSSITRIIKQLTPLLKDLNKGKFNL
jgi:RNA polymerase sigma factor (sigma-70 family)